MKKVWLAILLAICSIVCGYGQSTFRDNVAILKVEDADGTLDRSGVIMLQSAMVDAFSRLKNVSVIDCSGTSPRQGSTFQLSQIREIGRGVSADMVIVPSVTKINESEIFLTAKIVDVKTGIMDAGVNVKCYIRDKKEQATVFKSSCENLSKGLSNRILSKQMENITFSQGKLYRDGIELSESEIKSFFEGDGNYGRYSSYERWKRAEENIISGPKHIIAGSIVTSLGLGILAGGVVGLVATKGWPDDDMYRALSIGGTVVGAVTGVLIGPICFIGAKSKKAGWEEMENIFLERQAQLSRSRAELNFGTQKYGVGFALKF